MPCQQSFTWAVLALLLAAAVSTTALSPAPPSFKPAGKQKVTFSMGGGSLLGASYPDAFFELVPVGTSAVYSTELKEGPFPGGRVVGNVVWTGTYLNASRVNYLVSYGITEGDYQGTLIASGIGGGVGNSLPSTVVVVGGSGDFEGATGTIIWSPPDVGSAPLYTFKLGLAPWAQQQPGVSSHAASG